jgi:ethanolamine utilization cobalamin adenosyltransferase
MKKYLLTDVELRARWSRDRSSTYYVEEGAILTPSAKDFLKEHNIQLCYTMGSETTESAVSSMTMTPIPTKEGKARYRNAATGQELDQKPEEMTHLRGNLLVPKIHPQIEFRGRLDSLMARILEVQILAEECEEPKVLSDLDEILEYAHQILAAEVKDEPLPAMNIMDMDSQQIRYNSHHVKKVFGISHPIPNYRMGKLCVALNSLRTQVREVELAAAKAFCQGGTFTRVDIIEGLNRMSSCVYIILCRKLSGYYK